MQIPGESAHEERQPTKKGSDVPVGIAFHRGDGPAQENSEQGKRHSGPKKHDAFEWINLIAFVLTLSAACVGSWFAGRLVVETRNMIAHSDDAAEKQLEIARDTEMRQIRAYVYADISVQTDTHGIPRTYAISAKNDGSTPAYGVFAISASNVFDWHDRGKPEKEEPPPVKWHVSGSRNLLPGEYLYRDHDMRASGIPIDFFGDGTSELGAWNSGKFGVLVRSLIRFEDTFKREHCLKTCYVFSRSDVLSGGHGSACAQPDSNGEEDSETCFGNALAATQ